MTSHCFACTRGDHAISCIHDWRAKKEKIACKVKLENPNFDGYYSPSVFCDWLTDIECYLNWYELFDAARVLFARRKLVSSVRSYWESIERDCIRRRVALES